ncbi:YeeE/YedE thiosulfate transporter family protein [Maribellus sp. YY47]|uniref:YeeE/YedE thiosulfate transporter family protein n=1 Tax=Maribellus sp. YY47 TaxID=2929486 RepID=UPI0020009696|nr:YeeE/YedE thiosulfate transporter family protein [Maribellus sp. YY47]MCK3685410.1 YeeE/YedE family protein [Maribellus sp. YY47]
MILVTLILGFLFGLTLQYASLNKFNTISGMATLDNLTVAKAIAVAVGLGAILINIEIGAGLASFHVKPMILGGLVFGGILFGAGMAILGYCPGTLAISLGEGSIDALLGIIGGILAGVIYTLILPSIQGVLGPNMGTMSLRTTFDSNLIFYVLLFLVGAVFIGTAFVLNKVEKSTNYRWLVSGIVLAILNVIVFSKFASDRPIGASTTYPYVGDVLAGLTQNDYFTKIQKPGNWELIFLGGAFLAGLIGSLVKKTFRFQLVYENWEKYKGTSKTKRAVWAFVGGFVLIFGARMAGGCTSGHVLSGGMQVAFSSLLFAVVVFASLLLTGKFFYKK